MSASTLLPANQSEIAEAIAAGFVEGVPPWLSRETIAIDVKVNRRRRCPECGNGGLDLLAYHRRRDRRYRAFASCRKCQHVHQV